MVGVPDTFSTIRRVYSITVMKATNSGVLLIEPVSLTPNGPDYHPLVTVLRIIIFRVPVDCPILQAPANGTMIGVGNAFGTVIQFKCKGNFHLSGSEERRCQANRTWSGTAATCSAEIKCEWPNKFWNGYVLGEKTHVGSTVFFSCRVRTKFVGDYFDATCLPNGTWSHPQPTCWGQCQVPSIEKAILEGVRQGTWRDHGTGLRYQCVDGFVPQTSKQLMCNNGTWSDLPQCVPGRAAPCRDIPPPINNGLRIYTGRQNGRKAKYICLNGYRLAGMDVDNATLICQQGTWIGGAPRCEQVYCPNPGEIEHGKIYKLENDNSRFEFKTYIHEIEHGQRLGFECNIGYTLRGVSGATCIDGTWNPPLTVAL
ncbi:hypothetical protein FSP39_008882 [Pinctada imbricata]|uniref:Sushi domain-containing protein n=1 Tax=Pinctada imbricata TaxID=66713 RepID=A0AA88XS97_PINIB|nr:hypothetical protein FSP39_008882 [Pinctada imbricata]